MHKNNHKKTREEKKSKEKIPGEAANAALERKIVTVGEYSEIGFLQAQFLGLYRNHRN